MKRTINLIRRTCRMARPSKLVPFDSIPTGMLLRTDAMMQAHTSALHASIKGR